MKILSFLFVCLLTISLQAQFLTSTPSGGNKKAMVGEQIGLTQVSIEYDRPAVKGREGKIWGELVPTGFTDPGFGNTKEAPWRAGANENTAISFSTDVKIEGKTLPAGKYGFFIAYSANTCTLIFSKNSSSWGSYYYNPAEDALRVTVKPAPLDKLVEWLQYSFTPQADNAATIALQWEKLSIPFKVEVDLVATQLDVFRKELRNRQGFTWQGWDQAVQWCVQNNTNFEQALLWADSATSQTFGGNYVFAPHANKAQLLKRMNREAEADALMKKALPFANVLELHGYGRQLLQQKKNKEALEVFTLNHQKNPGEFTTLVGLVRGFSAVGDYKKALGYAQKALPLAPDPVNKTSLEQMVQKLKEGKNVNG